MGNFERDLAESEIATRKLIKALKANGIELVYLSDSKEYDFVVKKKGKVRKVEFKNDIKAETTGRVAIEKWSRGKPSGICTTEADYYIYQIGKAYYVMQTMKLAQFLLANSIETARGGDNNTSLMYIIPIPIFKKLKFVKQIL